MAEGYPPGVLPGTDLLGGGAVADPAIPGALDGSGDCVRGHSRGGGTIDIIGIEVVVNTLAVVIVFRGRQCSVDRSRSNPSIMHQITLTPIPRPYPQNSAAGYQQEEGEVLDSESRGHQDHNSTGWKHTTSEARKAT